MSITADDIRRFQAYLRELSVDDAISEARYNEDPDGIAAQRVLDWLDALADWLGTPDPIDEKAAAKAGRAA